MNHAYRIAAQNPARAGLDYATAMMGWPDRPCPAQGPIGMIDTGIDAALPELSEVRIVEERFQRGTPAPVLHGTEIAVLLADPRRLSGVTLYSAAVVGTSARGQQEAGVDSLLQALDWMAAQGAASSMSAWQAPTTSCSTGASARPGRMA
ncbi:S8/S53 family peptidase [Mangrovicoccus ximenensis]|uniref:hypothetical protein n=1 Tax=Mangrovicoccus ximenensis TaxID=1911570 RepID=UPI000D351265|nr:hypothetical protein [Mangrovicoccus ximenensis]